MARHQNQKIPTFSLKRALEIGQYDKVQHIYNQQIPEYILKTYKLNKEDTYNEVQ